VPDHPLVAAAAVEVLTVMLLTGGQREDAPAPLLHAPTVKAVAAREGPSGHLLSTHGDLSSSPGSGGPSLTASTPSLPSLTAPAPNPLNPPAAAAAAMNAAPPAGLMAKGRNCGCEDRRDSRLRICEMGIFLIRKSYV
jgi:hypothetical protein